MNKKIKKNILLICIIMLFIHILGLIYQIITHLPTLSILLKELFIILFLIQIVVVKLEIKKYQLICYIVNTIIIIISCIYMDFLSVIISSLLILYLYISNNTDSRIKRKSEVKK